MAQSIPFDTHAYVKKLRAVGVPEAQAEVQAEAFAELINDQLATKRDLAELETRLSAQIKELELRQDGRFKELELRLSQQELRLVVKLSAILVAVLAAFAALEKFF